MNREPLFIFYLGIYFVWHDGIDENADGVDDEEYCHEISVLMSQ